MGMISQNETITFELQSLSTYIFTEARLSNGDIMPKAEVGLIITGGSSDNVSSIIGLSRYDEKIVPRVKGFTFSLTMPNAIWGNVTLAKIL